MSEESKNRLKAFRSLEYFIQHQPHLTASSGGAGTGIATAALVGAGEEIGNNLKAIYEAFIQIHDHIDNGTY